MIITKNSLVPYNLDPSGVTNVYWIYTTREKGEYPETTMRSGKWLIFISPERLDLLWKKIKHAMDGKYATVNQRISKYYE